MAREMPLQNRIRKIYHLSEDKADLINGLMGPRLQFSLDDDKYLVGRSGGGRAPTDIILHQRRPRRSGIRKPY